MIKHTYTTLPISGFFHYLFLSLNHDALFLLFSSIILFFLLQGFYLFNKTLHTVTAAMVSLISLFFLMSIEFFRIYETTFQTDFIGQEHSTGYYEMTQSGFAEISNGFVLKLFFILLFIGLLTFLLYKWDKESPFYFIFEQKRSEFGIHFFRYFPPGLLVLLVAFNIAASPESKYIGDPSLKGKWDAKRIASLTHELSLNPGTNLFYKDRFTLFEKENIEGLKSSGIFSFQFNTDSIESEKEYTKSSLIPRGKKYNIILYLFESTPQKYVNTKFNGRYVMKTYNRLAKNSFIGKNHYANYPLSANALLNILTSSYGIFEKLNIIQEYPDIKLETISEILHKQGYRTLFLHTGELGYAGQNKFLKNRKFDSILDLNDLRKITPYKSRVGWGLDERAMVEPAADFIKKDPDKPFFMVLSPVNPHHPYAIPGEEYQITGEIPEDASLSYESWLNYCNSLHFADAAMGQIIDRLEKEGYMENTLFFFIADHGEAFYQHRMNYNHPLFLYEENVHVPFLIYNKKLFPEPVHFDGVTRHIDIAPTLMDILNMNGRSSHEGVSIFSNHKEQFALFHTFWKDEFIGIRDDKWKYICRIKDNFEELYDLTVDPDERKNVAEKNIPIVKRYRNIIQKARTYNQEFYKNILSGQ